MIMNVVSLIFIFYFCSNITLIYGDLDGQVSCAWGKSSRSKRETATTFLASSSVSKKDVKFILYEKEQSDGNFDPVQLLEKNAAALLDMSKTTIVFIHGYKSTKDKSSSRLVREGIFKNGDYNVIIVDWSAAQHRLGVLWPYDAVVKKLDAVGQHVSNMLSFLEGFGLDLSNLTVIGHSLGAHVAGIAGHTLGGKVGRIVGLDPAGPLFSERSLDGRLSRDDAKQVEVIHTEIDQCGLKNQMGHYDFYPNSGRSQPGCETYQCSHARSYRLYAESLDPNSKGFYARLCEDWTDMLNGNCNGEMVLMGGLSTKSAQHGLYYVETNYEPPYAKGRP